MFETTARIRPGMHYAWSGSSVLIVSPRGETDGVEEGGFWFRLTRFLDRLSFEIEGESPVLCSIAETSPRQIEASYLFPPVTESLDGEAAGGSGSGGAPTRFGIPTRAIDLFLRYTVRPAGCEVELTITNRWSEGEIEIVWLLGADYAGIGEVLGNKRVQPANVRQETDGRGIRFVYEQPDLPFATRVIPTDEAVWSVHNACLSTRIRLVRQQPFVVRLRIEAIDFEDPIEERDRAPREQKREAWLSGTSSLKGAGEPPLADLTNRAMRDLASLALLEGPEEEWIYPGAGVPLYLNVWGRDALTAAWQAGSFDRGEMLRAILKRLARLQATERNDATDAQPGRILNREQPQPSSRLNLDPFRLYYGDFSSPFMFIIGLGQFFAWSNDRETLRSHYTVAQRILDWARTDGDRDGDGYVEYLTLAPAGAKHQGWKDTNNAVVGERGEQIAPPVASCDAQAYWFIALQFMAVFALALGRLREARSYWREASALKRRFNRDFWMEDESCIALGLDAEKRPIRAVTSNAGHCLAAGIVDADKLPRLVERLFADDMWSGWGIRTLSSRNPAFNPVSYHLGSVWSVENATILFGLRRFGFDERTVQLARALYDLAVLWPGGRVPECVGGYDRATVGHPGSYPQSNAPQAWNESVWPILVQSLLGLQPLPALGVLAVDPILPEWLPDLTLRNLRVGEAAVTIHFWREADGRSRWKVLETDGSLRVVRQPPLNALGVHWWNRAGAVARSGRSKREPR